jgi:transposase-like protein
MLYVVKCPNCGKELEVPTKILENHVFCIESYKCDKCGTSFNVTIRS